MNKYLYLLIGIYITGCSHFLDDYSQDLVVAESVADLDEVMLGSCYLSNRATESFEANSLWWLHVLDDNITTVMMEKCVDKRVQEMNNMFFGYTTWQKEVGRNHDGNKLRSDNQVWDEHYRHINAVNIILAQFDEIKAHNDREELGKLRIKGECHFLRAYYYWMLANLYAKPYRPEDATTTPGIPIKTTEYVEHDKDKTTQFERAKLSEVYQLILSDLQQSIDFFHQSPQIHGFYRASEEAALLLLSRVYLYMQDWVRAKQVGERFMKKRVKLLDYHSYYVNEEISKDALIMSEKNPEIIFSQGSLSVHHILEAESGDFGVAKDLVSQYDTLDLRYRLNFEVKRDTGYTYSCQLTHKYRREIHRSPVSDVYVLRTAEGYLNSAEASAMSGDEGTANRYLNQLRQNRILDYQAKLYSGLELIDEIRLERRRELCFEGGHRWFDLRRYSVCREAPFKKVIERLFAYYDHDRMRLIRGELYHLNEDDLAYTCLIPKGVLEFDRGMEDNIRLERKFTDFIMIDKEK